MPNLMALACECYILVMSCAPVTLSRWWLWPKQASCLKRVYNCSRDAWFTSRFYESARCWHSCCVDAHLAIIFQQLNASVSGSCLADKKRKLIGW